MTINQTSDDREVQRRLTNALVRRLTEVADHASQLMDPVHVALAFRSVATNLQLRHDSPQFVADFLRHMAVQIEASGVIDAARKPH